MQQIDKKEILSKILAELECVLPDAKPSFLELKKLASDLKLNQFSIPVITVAGTNGKGTVVAALEAMLLAAGLRVAAYTSPHILLVNERIRINGWPITDEQLLAALSKIIAINHNLGYFQAMTLAAFDVFLQHQLDVVLLEVGIGGRLDAVNVVDADIAVITSIGLDHVETLGDTLEKIGGEKAGIVRANCPVILGGNSPEILAEHVLTMGALPVQNNKDFFIFKQHDKYIFKSKKLILGLPVIRLKPSNLAAAIAALEQLPYRIDNVAIGPALANLSVPGRFERRQLSCEVIFDVAHNPDSCDWMASQLRRLPCGGQTIAVFAARADKAIEQMITSLVPLVDCWYIGELDGAQTMLTSDKIIKKLQAMGQPRCYNAGNIEQAFSRALQASGSKDRIIVFGSFRTVAKVKQFLIKE